MSTNVGISKLYAKSNKKEKKIDFMRFVYIKKWIEFKNVYII